MNAWLIDANTRSIQAVSVDGLDTIRTLIGYADIDSDEIDASGDRLFFDESCFLRDQTGVGRFRLDRLAPVAGKGVVVSSTGEAGALQDAAVSAEALASRVTWL